MRSQVVSPCVATSRLAVMMIAAGLLTLAPMRADAGGKLDAKYEASLAGIPVGEGSWTVEISSEQYSSAANGATSGLMKAFAAGAGNGSSTGKVMDGELVPSSYLASVTMYKKTELTRIALQNGNVRDSSIDPAPKLEPARLVVTDEQKLGVVDPMTASLLAINPRNDPMVGENCNVTRSIFDGRMRYDLAFAFRRVDKVKAKKGYQGPALVCGVRFKPVSGYVPARQAIKYLASQRQIEVWLVPLAGTNILVPFRMIVPTPVGTAMLDAVEFNANAVPPAARAQ